MKGLLLTKSLPKEYKYIFLKGWKFSVPFLLLIVWFPRTITVNINLGGDILRLEQLKCLLDIAHTGSITNTAQRLFISQQAVSKSIKQLERELGIDLLIRTKTGVTLTAAGEEVVRHAETMLNEGEKLRASIEELKHINKKQSVIDISSTSSVTNLALPYVISKLNARQDKISIRVMPNIDFDSVLQLVQSGESDIGLMTINAMDLERKMKQYQDTLAVDILVHDELMAVMDRKLYKGTYTTLSADEFAKSPVRTIYNIIPIQEVRQDIYENNIIFSNDADFHRSMIERAGAVTLMSGLAYQYYFNTKRYVALNFQSEYAASLIHVAIYRKNADEQIRNIIAMIRREMHIQ